MISSHRRLLQIKIYNDTYFSANSRHIINLSLNLPPGHINRMSFDLHHYNLAIAFVENLFNKLVVIKPFLDHADDVRYSLPSSLYPTLYSLYSSPLRIPYIADDT